ncbi:DNA cytosine methyltransferase [Leptospira interrogans]|uniref:DNA cytosine methyltransferase n=1 Tax=Leptospira interrogans TaxID=173 RepID=UPI00034C7E9D|nr:DNA cytosine methyltransferase [Leptospira interrogans]UML76217.1 DNA cytosine methyltransferase [Leptospira interrogans]UML76400.1 DNA cytosine methyltransferase [Leptospira interrogans]
MNELALFAGAGGGILGGKLLGWRTVCAVEINPYCIAQLIQRQNDKILPPFPIWDDVCTFDGTNWRGVIDVVSGGFPCQGISVAGKGKGLEDERSGLWSEMFRIICEVRPKYVFLENSPLLTKRGIYRVLGDLASMGYNAIWGVLGADDVGAPHIRKRIWILAYASSEQWERESESRKFKVSPFVDRDGSKEYVANSNGFRKQQSQRGEQKKRGRVSYGGEEISNTPRTDEQRNGTKQSRKPGGSPDSGWWSIEPDVGRVAHGVAYRMDRLKAIGNGQVPTVVRLAWNILSSIIEFE